MKPALFRTFRTCTRSLGIGEKIMNYAATKVESGKEKQFKQMLDNMVEAPDWTLRTWKITLEKQLSSWMLYIPGISSNDEVKMVKLFQKTLDAMKEEELDDYKVINNAARTRIAATSGSTDEEVSKLLVFYKQTLVIAKWMKLRKAGGEPLPSTQEELSQMQEEDPKIKAVAASVLAPSGKRTSRGRRGPF